MLAAIAEQELAADVRAELEEYVVRATPTLVNRLHGGEDGLPTS
jgi:hypothetical protein